MVIEVGDSMEKRQKICFLGYKQLSVLARNVIDKLEYDDIEVEVCDCNVENLPQVVDDAVNRGYELFIAGSANAAKFRNCYKYHLVEIKLSIVDYLIAINKALEIGKQPVIAVYKYTKEVDFDLIERLSGIHVERIYYEDSSELFNEIKHMKGDVVIGAAHSNEIASTLEKKHILLYPGEETILSAIKRARIISESIHDEILKSKTMNEIFVRAPFGLITTDERGIITRINKTAEKQAEITSNFVVGRKLKEIVPNLDPTDLLSGNSNQTDRRHLLNGVMVRCVQNLIVHHQKTIGTLTTLYPDNSRQRKQELMDAERYFARMAFKDILGQSEALMKCRKQAEHIAEQMFSVVIDGETGCGKNIFAQCIHNASQNSKNPYVVINAATIPEPDVQNILLGREENGRINRGFLEIGREGTIVLQNLNMSSRVFQNCIMQVLTDKRFFRVYGTAPILFNGRFITVLTNENCHDNVEPQLWESLNVLKLTVPPLRERKEDIPLFFMKLLANEHIKTRKLTDDMVELLCYYSWPRNLTEISTVVKRYAFQCLQIANVKPAAKYMFLLDAIGRDKIMDEIRRRNPVMKDISHGAKEDIIVAIEDMKNLLKYNNEEISKELQISRTTLWRLMN